MWRSPAAPRSTAPLDSIQMSALVMLLVQSCVYYNSSAAEGSSRRYREPVAVAARTVAQSHQLGPWAILFGSPISITKAAALCTRRIAAGYLVRQLLQRCQRKEEAEYREFLKNFVDDLLAAVLLPDWPSAETLLQILCMVSQMISARQGGGRAGYEKGSLVARQSSGSGSSNAAYNAVATTCAHVCPPAYLHAARPKIPNGAA